MTLNFLLIFVCCFAVVGCGIPGIQRTTVNVEMSSLNEVKNDQLTHGCLVKANRGSRQFEQTVRHEKSDLGLSIQFSEAHISIDPDTDQVVLSIYCLAGYPHMLKNTTTEMNVFEHMYVSVKLDIEQRFESDTNRDHYLKELVRTGFSIDASAWSTPRMEIEKTPPNDVRFKSSELGGYVTVPYRLLGIWSQASPNCSGGFFESREVTIEVPPQTPESVITYEYIDPTLKSLQREPIYIPEWKLVGTVKGYKC